ncbi:alpha-1,2-mannosidase family domain protein [Mycobacterium kansasii]|nr:alpha-1,2-mannosidase family domain protein [Mycobacterium kansasii]
MTHASVGCAAFGDISMLPTTAPIGPRPWDDWEEIAHDGTEVGVPGYYTVRFPATGVTAELTATTRTGVGRFSYPANGQPALFHVRSGASLGATMPRPSRSARTTARSPDRRPPADSAARTTPTRCTSP